MTVLSAIFLLFLIMNPIGNVPLFLSILKNIPIERRRKIIIRELLIALLVLLFFMLIGKYILQSLQIAESSLGIAGGIILFLIAIKMIFPGINHIVTHDEKLEPLVVPLAVPLIAGIILISSEKLGRALGVRALLAIERLMGILLMLVSVDLILDGIKQAFSI